MNTIFLILAFICTFLAGKVYGTAKANGLFTIPIIPNGDELPRDKEEVSLAISREDMGFGGEWR